jgi:IclR family acetate operon transcriptional repressor
MESAERVSRVLLAFTAGQPVLGVSELARTLEMPKSAVHRTLTSLCRAGLVRQDSGTAKYRLGPRAVDIGFAALDHDDVRSAALPVMRWATEQTGETATLSLLAGRERFYAAQVESPHDVRMTVEVGLRAPLYAGASGRAILATFEPWAVDEYLEATELVRLTDHTISDASRLRAALDSVRAQGYAVSRGERDPWAAAVAAAFRDRDGRALGALSICGPLGRFGSGLVAEYGLIVGEAAANLSRALGADVGAVATND